MNAIKNIIEDAWDSFMGRVIILGAVFGWVPFVLLSEVHAQLTQMQ